MANRLSLLKIPFEQISLYWGDSLTCVTESKAEFLTEFALALHNIGHFF
jgi:hypothetical protein